MKKYDEIDESVVGDAMRDAVDNCDGHCDGDALMQQLEKQGMRIVLLEEDRGDGRMKHYGAGEQPWDTCLRIGWAPVGAAFSILRYLRRSKTPERDLRHAKVYFAWLRELGEMDLGVRDPVEGVAFGLAAHVFRTLVQELGDDEKAKLGLPSCFRLRDDG